MRLLAPVTPLSKEPGFEQPERTVRSATREPRVRDSAGQRPPRLSAPRRPASCRQWLRSRMKRQEGREPDRGRVAALHDYNFYRVHQTFGTTPAVARGRQRSRLETPRADRSPTGRGTGCPDEADAVQEAQHRVRFRRNGRSNRIRGCAARSGCAGAVVDRADALARLAVRPTATATARFKLTHCPRSLKPHGILTISSRIGVH